MNETRIRLSPVVEREPRPARMPLAHARRWISPYEEGLEPAARVFVTQRCFVRLCAHAGSDLDNEVGGALVGRWRVDRESGASFVVVEGALRAHHTRHGSAFLTFTQESLVALHEELEQRYPEREIVGWYHTHPRMGIFLSGYDTWLHEHFFPEPWQVALVIEPHSSTGGFFARRADGWLDPRRYFGFYELARGGRPSVVHWGNLQPETNLDLDFDLVQGG